MYQTIDADQLPVRTRSERAMQLRKFVASGKKLVRLVDVPEEDVQKVYMGLYSASQRKEFAGTVEVVKSGNCIYLHRKR